ncbi:hypothetical protein EDD16DRAFT_1175371 [Pisolithus croceorrhizus]|nr:hypothetical protein EDD16DRAFT_1175371 [Pisolithus croceorrhizus]KAI6125972.1 hypothetical protein EV401DRAFT_1936256 [Pisolithus croceorrhizus]KAI6169765.1 hypothetical protein EDD17DRAFT_30183 [Pisolithus thermaeus]
MSSTGVDPSAIGSNTEPECTTPDQSSSDELQDKGFPPQRHAGAIGLGPEYAMGASVSEKLEGLKEEIKGKITGRPELVEHGRELRTGELKRKEKEQADAEDPFSTPGNGQK